MKFLCTIALLLCLTSFQQKVKIEIPGQQTKHIVTAQEYINYITIKNRSVKFLEISVKDPATNLTIRSFGLGGFGKALIKVERNYHLTIHNPSKFRANILIDKTVKAEPNIYEPKDPVYIKFTLHNSSEKSIALVIPGVMNPNLSPNSDSGVSLKTGQKIYYKKFGKAKLLLEVTDKIKSGDTLNVAELIEQLEQKL